MSTGQHGAPSVTLPSRYRALRVLGSGGMATVHLALDTETGQEVAVKLLKRELAGAVAIERFLLEIRFTHELVHANIVPVHDSGEVEGIPYLVMPVVPGETLRARLDREGQLPLGDAVRITAAVADALHAAHAHGIVHRDVKPGNILLHGADVYLTDFGIARALSRSATERITESGLSVGTAGYMSPEQAAGEHTVDRRSDVYSLACVTYEMLAGEPPFSGSSAQAVIAKQMSLPVPSISVLRPRLPEKVDDVLERALAKAPVDRFDSAQEFSVALSAAAQSRTTTLHHLLRLARRERLALAGGAAVIAFVGFANRDMLAEWARGLPDLAPEDSSRFAVLPFAPAADSALTARVEQAARSALLRWTDLTVLDQTSVAEALAPYGDAPRTPRMLARAARELRAGRYLRGEVRATDGGHEVLLRIVDGISSDTTLAEGALRLSANDAAPADSAVAGLVDALLVGAAAGRASPAAGTRSLAARRAYVAGSEALAALELARADSAFALATRQDPRFAAAHLGLALTRLWRGEERARWRPAAEQAGLWSSDLPSRERAMAEAVAAHARDDQGTACAAWRALAARDTTDGLVHLGFAHCLTTDSIVLPDRRSPSGWRFRSSYQEALTEYQRAFRSSPALLASFGEDAMRPLRRLFRTSGTHLRYGRAPAPDPAQFTAYMTWAASTLAFVPYPRTPSLANHVRDVQAGNEAVRRQRLMVRDLAASWVAWDPGSADALHALAVALAALGDPSALDTLARARSLARAPEQRLRVTGTEISLRLAFAVRDLDTLGVRRVRMLIDSLARSPGAGQSHPVLMTSLDALTGRARDAVRHARAQSVASALGIPAQLRDAVPPLMILSALGGPADTLRILEARVVDQIAHAVPQDEQGNRRREFLARAASMAFPDHRFAGLDAFAAEGDQLVALQSALMHGDTARTRRGLEAFRSEREARAPETFALDAVVPEAALWLALGDAAEAAAWLDPVLRALPQMEPGPLASPLRAASLGRALLLRARAAERLGDAVTATQCRTMIRILWSDADPFLRRLLAPASPRS